MAIVSDDEIPSKREVYTSDTTSTDDNNFQPFALPDVGVEPADGFPAGDLPLAVIPAPIPLAAFPVLDMPLDVVSDDDIDLFEEDPPEADHEGGAPIVTDVILPIAEAPIEELPVGSPVPDSFESVASASLHTQGVQHHSPDTPTWRYQLHLLPHTSSSLTTRSMMILIQSFPLISILTRRSSSFTWAALEAPEDPIDPLFDIPADFDMDLVDPEPVVAPEPVAAPDPTLEYDPVHDDAPAITPLVNDIPIADPPVVAPPLVDDPVVDAPIPDPVPVLYDRAPFAAHIDPRYADTHNGWIDDDDDYPPFVLPVTPPVALVSAPIDIPLFPPHTTDAHRTDLPITFLQDIPPSRPGEGSSRQPPVFAPPVLSSPFPFASQFPHVAPPTAPSFTPSIEPFLWNTPPIMPLSDPYHPYHVGYSTEYILTSLMIQQEALTRRIQELERAPRPPYQYQTPFHLIQTSVS
ncbi:proline-rich protein 36-like [Helianthus annuus]|uniref:proline-rich protein 36-like n=1 Tax=Helianthus annuus TaxID=4232 RepID=UPI000B8EF5D9|nr:proline-rich protein 36-like [Helianthus annuus]